MTVEFISAINVRQGDELNPRGRARPLDPDYLRRYARTLEDAGFDYTLVPYGSAGADSFVVATAVAAVTERSSRSSPCGPTRSSRRSRRSSSPPSTSSRTAARSCTSSPAAATPSRHARATSSNKDERYDRSEEWIEIVRRSWTEQAPFSHDGTYYRFDDFGPGFRPYSPDPDLGRRIVGCGVPRRRSARRHLRPVGRAPRRHARPDRPRRAESAVAAGRTDTPRIWVTFRPIVAETDELAWEKAHRQIAKVAETYANAGLVPVPQGKGAPQNVGSQRLLDAAARGEVHDRALWTKPADVTNASGASTALVGSYETVAAAILDYVDLGADLISIRGYDNLNDAIDYGRYVLPLVRQELAHREATGVRGEIVAQPPIVEGVRA